MLEEKARHARRRAATLRVALERWSRRAALDGVAVEQLRLGGRCLSSEVAPWYLAKRSIYGSTSKKRFGHPKGGRWGKSLSGRPSWKARVRSRRLEADIARGRLDPEWVTAPQRFWGWVECRPPRLRCMGPQE